MGEPVHRPLLRSMLFAFAGCFVAAAVLAQERPSPPASTDSVLSVETLGLEPTVGKSGDVVDATYRLRFRDMVREGREVMILEDRMAPERLPLAPFDAVGLDVQKQQTGDQHTWTFTYHVRVIGLNKGIVKLPSIAFYWLVRDLGQSVEKAEVRQTASAPLQFRYVSTITDEPVLDIRDDIELGSFARRATLFRVIAWIVAPLPLVAWVVSAGMALRRRRTPLAPVKRSIAREEPPDPLEPIAPTIRQARGRLRHEARALQDLAGAHGHADIPAQAELVRSLKRYLTAELPNLNPGDTARDISRHIQRQVTGGIRKEALGALAAILVDCQDELEQEVRRPTRDPLSEVQRIDAALAALHPSARWRDRVRQLLTRR